MRFYDLSIPSHLTAALLPDLVLIVGAMILLLVAVWRRESPEQQRTVGVLSIGLAVAVGQRRSHRRGQLPLDGGHRHPARHHRRVGARHRRQRPCRDDHGRDPRAHPARLVGDDAARCRARPDDRLPRHRADVRRGLRARGDQPSQRAVRRGRAQVFPARSLLHRLPPLRHRAGVRCHGDDGPARDRRAGAGAEPRHEPDPADRHRAPARRVRLQGVHGALPYVGARRVRRLAQSGHGVHGRHGEGGGVRGIPARLARGLRGRVRRLASRRRRPGDRHHDRRQCHRAAAAQPQAAPRVLVHRPRRLHPRRHRRSAPSPSSSSSRAAMRR